jgi:hypothetical protein
MYVLTEESGGLPRTHAGFEHKNRNISERLGRRCQVLRLHPMAENEFPVTLAPEKSDSRHAINDFPLLG